VEASYSSLLLLVELAIDFGIDADLNFAIEDAAHIYAISLEKLPRVIRKDTKGDKISVQLKEPQKGTTIVVKPSQPLSTTTRRLWLARTRSNWAQKNVQIDPEHIIRCDLLIEVIEDKKKIRTWLYKSVRVYSSIRIVSLMSL
jgi:hypothetical protein